MRWQSTHAVSRCASVIYRAPNANYHLKKNIYLIQRHFNSPLHLVKNEISFVLRERIKTFFDKFKKRNKEKIDTQIGVDEVVSSSLNKALVLYEKHNIKHMENLYKEILTCVDVLNYKEEEVDKKLNELRKYLKSKTNNIDPYIFCEKNIKNIDKHIYNIIKTGYRNIDEYTTYLHSNKGKRFRIVVGILLKDILTFMKEVNQKCSPRKRMIGRKEIEHIEENTEEYNELKVEANNEAIKTSYKKTEEENHKATIEKKKEDDSRKGCTRTSYLKKKKAEEILENQSKMIAAYEIIHMGSLLHDDVVDEANYRRGALALHKKFSNKVSILSGDFLLARAGSVISSFGNPEICKRFSYVIESLIKGEFLQINAKFNNIEDALKIYLIKSYHKTAALLSHACACIAILTSHNEQIIKHCFYLGLHIGMAFQLYDDFLDFKSSQYLNTEKNGIKIKKVKDQPLLHDLQNNIKTAPLFFSYEYSPKSILSLINKNRLTPDDVHNILFYIKNTNSMKKNELCSLIHIKRASDILSSLIAHCKTPRFSDKDSFLITTFFFQFLFPLV